MARRHAASHDAVRITSAPPGRSEEISSRQVRYLISMAVRVVCFVAAVLIFDGWLRWVMMTAAILLPYVAVVFANNTEQRADHFTVNSPGTPELPDAERKEL